LKGYLKVTEHSKVRFYVHVIKQKASRFGTTNTFVETKSPIFGVEHEMVTK